MKPYFQVIKIKKFSFDNGGFFKICSFIHTLFSYHHLHFISPSSKKEIRSTHKSLQQGNCLRSILFNTYISSINFTLSNNNLVSFFCADYIIVFPKYKVLEDSITEVNSVLKILYNYLQKSFLKVAPDK